MGKAKTISTTTSLFKIQCYFCDSVISRERIKQNCERICRKCRNKSSGGSVLDIPMSAHASKWLSRTWGKGGC